MANRLLRDQALLVVIDLQERLLAAIEDHERVVGRAVLLAKAARLLEIPILWTEQNSARLGPTHPNVVEAIGEAARPLEKLRFGCLDDQGFFDAAAASGRTQMILCGIEAHVCVLQSALRAVNTGWGVFIPEDAVGSRRAWDLHVALARLSQAGAVPATAEMLVMEALGGADDPAFKQILPLLKA